MGDDGWSKVASLYDGPRAVGGRLHIQQGRLRFVPHVFDKALQGRSLDVALSSVSDLSLTRRTWFAPRRHLLVETSDGQRARFLINGARQVIGVLDDAVRSAGTEPSISE